MADAIFICMNCGLGFDQRTRIIDYEQESSLVLDYSRLKKYVRYAHRITGILNKEIETRVVPDIKKMHIDILEVGSGYGLMSDFITSRLPIRNYYHHEPNRNLTAFLKSRNKKVLNSLDEIGKVDMIIMGQVLEHIPGAKDFLTNLLKEKLQGGGYIFLLQTDHRGIIPRFFARLWYGWQLQEHYFHFTPSVFQEFCRKRSDCEVVFTSKYSLDQEFTFALHGFAKLFLKLVNLLIPARYYDAFIFCIKKKSGEN